MLNHKGFILYFLIVYYGSVLSEPIQGNLKNDCGDSIVCVDKRTICPPGYVACATDHMCIREEQICNGIASCPDGSDERNCSAKIKTGLDQGICEDGYKACDDGVCLDNRAVCDGRPNCPDGSDEKYCDLGNDRIEAEPAIQVTYSEVTTPTSTTPTSEEDMNAGSDEKNKDFRLDDEMDHCAHYKRMIILVRRVHLKLAKMELKTARHIRHLINEILMEAGMENFASLLELHQVCNAKVTEEKPSRKVPL